MSKHQRKKMTKKKRKGRFLMDANIGARNIKWFNSPLKQKEIRLLITRNKLEMVAILKTKVKNENCKKVRKNSFSDSDFTNNNGIHLGGRI